MIFWGITPANCSLTIRAQPSSPSFWLLKVGLLGLCLEVLLRLSPVNLSTVFPSARDLSVIICIVGIMVVVLVASAVFKFRIDLALFLRDSLGCYGTPPGGEDYLSFTFRSSFSFVCSSLLLSAVVSLDGKKYDACLMFYKSSSGVELGKADRKWLEGILEERFGYSLCLLSENFSEDNGMEVYFYPCLTSWTDLRLYRLQSLCPSASSRAGLWFCFPALLIHIQGPICSSKSGQLLRRKTLAWFSSNQRRSERQARSLHQKSYSISAGQEIVWSGKAGAPWNPNLPSGSFCVFTCLPHNIRQDFYRRNWPWLITANTLSTVTAFIHDISWIFTD